mgnify:CR=1 FL=1
MGKPLLTDEMIARANRGDKFYDKGHFDSEETIVISTAVSYTHLTLPTSDLV